MKIKVIDDIDTLKTYRDIWDEILEENGNQIPFIEIDWIIAWWKYLGHDRVPFILMIIHKDEVIGFCPLMKTKKGIYTEINFIGYPLSDYMDFVISTKYRKESVEYLVNYLMKLDGNYIFNLHGMFCSSENTEILEKALRENTGYLVRCIEAPYLNITGNSFMEYFYENFGRESRYVIRKKEKRLKKAGKLVYEKLDMRNMSDVFKLHDKRWKGKNDSSRFSKGRTRELFKYLSSLEDSSLNVQIDLLSLNDRLIAFLYGFETNGRYLLYRIGHDDDFSPYSPGHLIIKFKIEESFSGSTKIFDFGIGDEDYKYRWTNDVLRVKKIIFPSRTIISKIIYSKFSIINKIKKLLSKSDKINSSAHKVLWKIRCFMSQISNLNGYRHTRNEDTHRRDNDSVWNFIKRIVRNIYTKEEFIIFERDLDDCQEKKYKPGYEVHEATIDDLDLLSDIMDVEPSHVVERFFKRNKCYIVSDNDKVLSLFWINISNIFVPSIKYYMGIEKGEACIYDWLIRRECENNGMDILILQDIMNILSKDGYSRCYCVVDNKKINYIPTLNNMEFHKKYCIKIYKYFSKVTYTINQ